VNIPGYGDRIGFQVLHKSLDELLLPVVFNDMFQLIFRQESTEYGQKKHQELPEIGPPALFPLVMRVMMYFHGFDAVFVMV
jgi:hypothetical protein